MSGIDGIAFPAVYQQVEGVIVDRTASDFKVCLSGDSHEVKNSIDHSILVVLSVDTSSISVNVSVPSWHLVNSFEFENVSEPVHKVLVPWPSESPSVDHEENFFVATEICTQIDLIIIIPRYYVHSLLASPLLLN